MSEITEMLMAEYTYLRGIKNLIAGYFDSLVQIGWDSAMLGLRFWAFVFGVGLIIGFVRRKKIEGGVGDE